MRDKIGIVGYGICGGAVEYGFKKDADIKYYDKFKDSDTLKDVCEHAEFIFITLPTPYKGNRIDLSIIENTIEEMVPYTNETDKIIVIKSTVVPGTTKKFIKKYPHTNFAFNPEFLTEANYLEDFVNADRHVIGAENNKIRLRVSALYTNRWPKTKVFQTDTATAELSKYAANCLLATKVMFANEMYDLCEKLGIEWHEAKEIVTADRRIGDTHLEVTTNRGYSGKCFPKDIVAILGVFDELGVDASLLKTVWNKNLKIRKIKDWEDIPFVVTEED